MKSHHGLELAQRAAKNPLFIKKNLVREKNWGSIGYWIYRIGRPLCKLHYKVYKLFRPHTPWTSPASIAFFDAYLTTNMKGLEYGSGVSTAYFAQRLGELDSVEHYEPWYEKVKSDIKKSGAKNVNYFFIPPDDANGKPYSFEKNYDFAQGGINPRRDFYSYVEHSTRYPKHSLDFILIDGRARVECGLNCIDALKPGGCMVLDNAERKRYQYLINQFENWPSVFTTMGTTDTVIFFKPNE